MAKTDSWSSAQSATAHLNGASPTLAETEPMLEAYLSAMQSCMDPSGSLHVVASAFGVEPVAAKGELIEAVRRCRVSSPSDPQNAREWDLREQELQKVATHAPEAPCTAGSCPLRRP